MNLFFPSTDRPLVYSPRKVKKQIPSIRSFRESTCNRRKNRIGIFRQQLGGRLGG